MNAFTEAIRPFYLRHENKILPLGMGCAWLGGATDADGRTGFQETLHTAYDRGVRYFDTSAKYGASEFRVGQFVRSVPRDTIFLATKCPIPTELAPDEAARFFQEAITNSRERLGVETLDLFLIHDVETLDQVLAPEGALNTLRAAKKEGRIRFFGLATRFHDLLEVAVRQGEFDAILTFQDYTPVNQSAAPLIGLAAEQGVGVINASPLAFGLLTGEDPRTNQRIQGEQRLYRGKAANLYDFCQEMGVPLLATALQYPLLNRDISITLTGPATPAEVDAGIDAATRTIPDAFWKTLESRLKIPLPRR